ncbi:LptA/OstA family protein [Steroidobacter denitrificans]|uniref:LptA/OstA family protein n=1 Tax=Steroidobacter denitrificans TaxID=465721 RepID=UPI0014387666|nr:LptA/OstA family protein [Steroidobacter denitrificans]
MRPARRPISAGGLPMAMALLTAMTLPVVMGTAAAQAPRVAPGFVWSADVLNSDFRSDTLELSGNVRVQQGPMSIQAQAATAQDFRSQNSRWTFQDAVHVRTAAADLQSDVASATVVNGEIASARVQGTPAIFEQRGGPTDSQVRGRAGTIEYDFVTGIVTLTNQVWFSNGKDEFRGDVVIYNIHDERVQINPDGSSSGRVRGIIRPRENQPSGEPLPERLDHEPIDSGQTDSKQTDPKQTNLEQTDPEKMNSGRTVSGTTA